MPGSREGRRWVGAGWGEAAAASGREEEAEGSVRRWIADERKIPSCEPGKQSEIRRGWRMGSVIGAWLLRTICHELRSIKIGTAEESRCTYRLGSYDGRGGGGMAKLDWLTW